MGDSVRQRRIWGMFAQRLALCSIIAAFNSSVASAATLTYIGTSSVYQTPDAAAIPIGASATLTLLIDDRNLLVGDPNYPEGSDAAFYRGRMTLSVGGYEFLQPLNIWMNCDEPGCWDYSVVGDRAILWVVLSWEGPSLGGYRFPEPTPIGYRPIDPYPYGTDTSLSDDLPPAMVWPISIPYGPSYLENRLDVGSVQVRLVPEPTSLLLLGTALAGMAVRRRFRC